MISLSVCSISFRHQLLGLPQLARWASLHGFQGIELWGVHARNLAMDVSLNQRWLANLGLEVTMISDYLPVCGQPDTALSKLDELCHLAKRWGSTKLRTFAGQQSSADTPAKAFAQLAQRLRLYCDFVQDQGVELLIETHPNTFADATEPTLQLLAAVDHPALRVNFDVLHLWEAGEDPNNAWQALRDYVSHLHLKNVVRVEQLPVFAPHNVYSPAGSRDGMVPLFDGALDYRRFLRTLAPDQHYTASLEWFGDDAQAVLAADCHKIHSFWQLQTVDTITQRHRFNRARSA